MLWLCAACSREAVLRVLFFSCVTFPWQLCPQDFLIMFLHHVATISLITFSYVNNMARVGTLVMCLHDAADVLIEVRGWNAADGQMAKMVVCVGGVFGVYMLSYPSSSKINYSPYIMNIMSDCIIQVQCMLNILFRLWYSRVIPSFLILIFQALVYMIRLMIFFFYQGCQDGQLCQMSDTVQPTVCNVCNSLHKFQAGSLPCLVSVTLFPAYHS